MDYSNGMIKNYPQHLVDGFLLTTLYQLSRGYDPPILADARVAPWSFRRAAAGARELSEDFISREVKALHAHTLQQWSTCTCNSAFSHFCTTPAY
jgi:hypothetical protein